MWDAKAMFSNGQAVTATANSSNVFEGTDKDIASGRHVTLQVMTSKAGGGAGMTVNVQTADDEAMASPVTIASYPVDAETLAKGGPVLAAALPARLCKKFLRLAYEVDGAPTNLTVTAGLMLDGQTNN